MTIYKSTQYGTELDTWGKPGRIEVGSPEAGHGFYVDLSKEDRIKLALEILAHDYEIRHYPEGQSRQINLKPKQPPAPVVKVGEYYRIPGEPDMAEPWRGSPVVKVTKAPSQSYIILETADGDRTGWSDTRALIGPLKVTEKTEWTVES
jgi:hypothetical protein